MAGPEAEGLSTAASSFVRALSCPRCGRELDHRRPTGLCLCGSPLLVEYDLEAASARVTRADVAEGPATMWRYAALLPLDAPEHAASLGEGFTPLLSASRLGRRIGVPHLLVKDEGPNPTGTFKARGAACGVSRARELGIVEVALATAGNAGGAWAAYGAAAKIRVHVAMPTDAPQVNQLECRLFGADLTLVDGLISDAADAISSGVDQHGWFDVSTLKEPYRIEGKKTLGFELAEQLSWRMPDVVVYPAGGGVGIIGIWRGLLQLREIGWVAGGLPRLVVVQSEGCAPLVRAFDEGADACEQWEGADTFAAGLRVPKPLGDFLVLRAVRETGGTAVAVSDEAIAHAMRALAEDEGVFACPEGAATLAGAGLLRERGDISEADRVVLIDTGTAAKYPEAVARALEERATAEAGDEVEGGRHA